MRRRPPPPWALTALTALVYAVLAPPTTDLAAQSHRVALARDGVWLYDLSWFGGHHLPGYSVLMPVLGLGLGPAVITACSAVAASWAYTRLATRAWPGAGGTVAAWWFAAGVGGLQFTGRTTFLLGTALALGTLLVARCPGTGRHDRVTATDDGRTADRAAGDGPAGDATGGAGATPPVSGTSGGAGRRRRAALAAAGGILTALASPVAALFLAMAAGAWWLSDLRRLGGPGGGATVPAVVAAAALVAAGALSVAFPTGGSEPFVASALWPAVALLAVALVVLPADQRTLRIGVGLYLVAVVLAGALPTPMGGNATRLAALAGGPLVAAALWGRRPLALALLALPLLWWQWYPPVRDASQAWADPSARASYWAPVRDALRPRLARDPGARVEVVPTARRGEARWLSPDVPLARGWIRQLDRDRSPLFYDDLDGPPTPAAYRAWLDDEGVSWVVLTDATPDHASEDEAALLRAGRVPGLELAARGTRWSLWRVRGARPLATWVADPRATPTPGPAVVARTARSLTLRVPRAGLVDLRIRWSPYLRARGGNACTARGRGGWTVVRTTDRDTVRVDTAPAVPWRRADRNDCEP